MIMNFLLSVVATLYVLGILYFPSVTFRFVLSPVALFTLVVLLLPSQARRHSKIISPIPSMIPLRSLKAKTVRATEQSTNESHADSFVEWSGTSERRWMLYTRNTKEKIPRAREIPMNDIHRYASLLLFYPDSDTDTSSDGDSPESTCFRWEEEEDDRYGYGLIEIALDGKRHIEVDGENMIEIDLSPAR